MLVPLSQATIFERRRKAQRDRWLLLGALLIGQGFFIYLMLQALLLAAALKGRGSDRIFRLMAHRGVLWSALGLALVLTLVQAWLAWRAQRRDLRSDLEARDPNREDERHQAFAKAVKAVSLAAGLPGARTVVTAKAGFNSYGWEDPDGRAVIGISEGLLGRLDQAEMEAIGAHHAAHIRFGDARLFVFAGSVVGVFDSVGDSLLKSQSAAGGRGGPAVLFLLVVSNLAAFCTRLVFGLVVTGRKLHADAAAVAMTRDPLALASALHTAQAASLAWQGLPESLTPLLLVPGSARELGSHSPSGERLRHLLTDAHSSIGALTRRKERRRTQRRPAAPPRQRFWHYEGGAWTGPWDLAPLRARPGFDGQSWVSPDGAAPRRALADETLGTLFQPGSRAPGRCPRCGTGLMKDRREGLGVLVCRSCGGHALGAAALERLTLRHDEGFAPAVYAQAQRLREREWRRGRGNVAEDCGYPAIQCPHCGGATRKRYFSYMAMVVVDKCSQANCGAIWLDDGELELIQVLTEEPLLGTAPARAPDYRTKR